MDCVNVINVSLLQYVGECYCRELRELGLVRFEAMLDYLIDVFEILYRRELCDTVCDNTQGMLSSAPFH